MMLQKAVDLNHFSKRILFKLDLIGYVHTADFDAQYDSDSASEST